MKNAIGGLDKTCILEGLRIEKSERKNGRDGNNKKRRGRKFSMASTERGKIKGIFCI
jgi:hypothetical protein